MKALPVALVVSMPESMLLLGIFYYLENWKRTLRKSQDVQYVCSNLITWGSKYASQNMIKIL